MELFVFWRLGQDGISPGKKKNSKYDCMPLHGEKIIQDRKIQNIVEVSFLDVVRKSGQTLDRSLSYQVSEMQKQIVAFSNYLDT